MGIRSFIEVTDENSLEARARKEPMQWNNEETKCVITRDIQRRPVDWVIYQKDIDDIESYDGKSFKKIYYINDIGDGNNSSVFLQDMIMVRKSVIDDENHYLYHAMRNRMQMSGWDASDYMQTFAIVGIRIERFRGLLSAHYCQPVYPNMFFHGGIPDDWYYYTIVKINIDREDKLREYMKTDNVNGNNTSDEPLTYGICAVSKSEVVYCKGHAYIEMKTIGESGNDYAHSWITIDLRRIELE